MRRFIALFVMCGLVAWGVLLITPPPALHQSQTILIPRQTGLWEIGKRLEQAGIVQSSYVFVLGAILTQNQNKLKAGEYLIPAKTSLFDIIRQLAEGRVIKHTFTVPEGYTVFQIAALLNEITVLEGEIRELPREGYLLPATYEYIHGDQRVTLLAKMQQKMAALLDGFWQSRPTDCPLKTPEEALTLASIVEKETGIPNERARIAGVFLNRLRLKMPLQSDPTVIYGLTFGKPTDRLLTYTDLHRPTPYNTYMINALPPTPIACPGTEALRAVFYPEKTKALFFVANGTGGHVFSDNFETHKVKVKQWRQIQKARTNVPLPSATSPSGFLGVSQPSSGS